MARLTQIEKQTRNRDLLAGLAKHKNELPSFFVGNKRRTPDEVGAVLQQHNDAMQATRAARALWIAAVRRERAIGRDANDARLALEGAVINQFGPKSVVTNAHFGVRAPGKPGPKTVKAKARGAEKLRATRALRGTIGKRAKAKIKGTLTPKA